MRLIDANALAARYMGTPPDYYHTSQIVGEITAAPTVKLTNWISVKDRVPEKKGDYLVYTTDGIVWPYWYESFEWYNSLGYRTESVTHWMPLPEPPEEVSGGD